MCTNVKGLKRTMAAASRKITALSQELSALEKLHGNSVTMKICGLRSSINHQNEKKSEAYKRLQALEKNQAVH